MIGAKKQVEVELGNLSELHAGYDAIRSGVALLEIPAGKLQLSGKNAVQFLNGLVSNEVKTLPPGEGVLAAFPTLQGKLAALCRIYNTGEHLLIELDAINREKIFKNLSRFVPAGEFFVADASDLLALVSLQGKRSPELIESLTGQPAEAAECKISKREIAGTEVWIASHKRCGEPGFDLFVETGAAAAVAQKILEAGARRISEAAFEIARIEAGVPREGVDAGEEYIILESELESAVSYTKGCYLGQEVIARIHWRGQPAKRLRGLLIEMPIEADALPPRGTELWAVAGQMAGRRAGEITSSAFSFALNQNIALGYAHRYCLEVGTEFILKQGDAELGRARLVELPFVK